MTNQPLTTKKQCKDLGMRTESLWFRAGRIPKRGAQGIVVKGDVFFAEDETEEMVSRTEAGRRGLRTAGDPVGRKSGCVGNALKRMEWEVFRVSDCVPKQKRKCHPARKIDLLAAIFTVNRAAKRYRDAAANQYHARTYALASYSRSRKTELYELKERGIIFAYRNGKLEYEGIHGKLGVYRGEGYCFHSTRVPTGARQSKIDDTSPIRVEAKPRHTREPRLTDAVYTINQLPIVQEAEFDRKPVPRHRMKC